MRKKIKKIKKGTVADVLLITAMLLVFCATYDIEPHAGMYVLSAELVTVGMLIVKSGDKK